MRKTPETKIKANRVFSSIGLHHHNHAGDNNYRADNHVPLDLLLKTEKSS